MADDADLQPEPNEVMQQEAPDALTVIPVCVAEVKAPVRTQQLPRKGGSTRTKNIGATTAVQVARADHRCGQVEIMSIDQNIRVAYSEAACQADSSMSIWPKLVPLTITATVDVWVKAVTGTTDVSVTTERWAEG